MKKRQNYQTPQLYRYEEMGECRLLVGTTIFVDPFDEGSQSQAEGKSSCDYFEEVDKSIRSYEHNPLDYLPRAFKDHWQEE